MSVPATMTSPDDTFSRPAATMSNDDLPDPEGPSKAIDSPVATDNEMADRMLTGPAALESVRLTSLSTTMGEGRCMRTGIPEDGARRYCFMNWVFKRKGAMTRASLFGCLMLFCAVPPAS